MPDSSFGRRVVFDLTDLLMYYSELESVSGIQRVVERLAASECLQGDPHVSFVVRSRTDDAFWSIDKSSFADLQRSDMRSAAIARLLAIRRYLNDYRRLARLRKYPWKALQRKYSDLSRRIREIKVIESWCNPFNFEAGDILVILGAFWLEENISRLYVQVRQRHRLRLILFVYDLIPINNAWCVSAQFNERFSCEFRILISNCDQVVVISRHVASEVVEYTVSNVVDEKAIFVLPLGWDFPEYLNDQVSKSATLAKYGLKSRNFIMVVGTIERRKNHLLVARAAYSLYPRLGDKIPPILFVGKRGFGADFIEEELASMGCVGGRIRILANTADHDLVNLYESCLFTIFPSFVEGWGLPVQESLAFGRPCLASRATSIPEAGLDLATYFDPHDLVGFERLLAKWIEDPGQVSNTEARIANHLAARKSWAWQDTAAALMNFIRNEPRLCGPLKDA
jgi:glycosyltransferase involved in cell wall biosynthesis